MPTFIIKPLTEDYKEVEFRTTRVEGEILDYKVQHGLALPQFTQDDPYLKKQIMDFGTLVHEIFLGACLDGKEAGRELTNKNLPVIEQMISEISEKYQEKIKAKKPLSILNQLEYLKRVTLPRGDFIALSEKYPANLIEFEIPLEIHAGKYKIKIITKIDHVYEGETIVLSDLKSATKLREDNPLEEYNVNNIEGNCLENKLQLFIYSLAAMLYFETEEMVFKYIVFEKHDTKKKEKPFNSQEIVFRVSKQEAEEKVREVIIFYFKKIFDYDTYCARISERDNSSDIDE